jgi:RNA polymerase sigma factor (sigma-70 family)
MVSPASAVATDEQLVDAAREGSDKAFEALFRRYRDRIAVHVRGMVHDKGRAEDIVQDSFVSALRSLRASDQEIVFRPWIYQIARNACIDHLRRVKRTEEISIDSDEFWPDFEGHVSGATPEVYTTVVQRQSLDDLQQAFGGLPDSQYEILVLREFEGLSYQEIGRRMRLTPAAVESMLSRARRSLKGHFDEIVTGERCLRMRPVMAAVSHGLAGKRDRRMLARHVRHCRSCRQDAIELGLAAFVSDSRSSVARNALSRAAAFLPLPFLRRRLLDEPADPSSGISASVGAQAHLVHVGTVAGASAEQTASVLQKAAAVVAVAAVASGGGIVAQKVGVGVPLPNIAASGKKATPSGGAPLDPSTQAKLDSRQPAAAGSGGDQGNGAGAGGGSLPAGSGAPATSPNGSEGQPSAPLTGPGTPAPAGPLGGATPLGPRTDRGTLGPESPDAQPSPPGKAKDKAKNDSSSSDGPAVPAPSSTDDLPPLTDNQGDLPLGIQRRIERAGTIPPGIQKKLDKAAAAEPVADIP